MSGAGNDSRFLKSEMVAEVRGVVGVFCRHRASNILLGTSVKIADDGKHLAAPTLPVVSP